MIDGKMFDMQRLLDVLLDDHLAPNWRRSAEILLNQPNQVHPNQPKRAVVRLGTRYLCYSKGPMGGHLWDTYGDDYLTPELALLALLRAEPPSSVLKDEMIDVWRMEKAGSVDLVGSIMRQTVRLDSQK